MATPEYDKNNCTRINLKLNNKTDADIIEKLDGVENKQGYIKRLIKNDVKGGNTMKTYIIKPEFMDLYGADANPMTVLTEEEVEQLAGEWEKDVEELKGQLIEERKTAFRPIHRFPGNPDWEALNELIRFDSGCEEDYCETEEDYRRAVHDGFIGFDGYYTTVYVDD